jgi:hypothetical protein
MNGSLQYEDFLNDFDAASYAEKSVICLGDLLASAELLPII